MTYKERPNSYAAQHSAARSALFCSNRFSTARKENLCCCPGCAMTRGETQQVVVPGLPGGLYDTVYHLAFVGDDCVLASFAAACLDLDTGLDILPAHNSSVMRMCKDSASVVRAAGWTNFAYRTILGIDDQEWPVLNRRQSLSFLATLDNFPNEERIRCFRLLCAAKEDDSTDAEEDLETLKQAITSRQMIYAIQS